MSISAAAWLFFAAQFQGVCVESDMPDSESDSIATVRNFIALGDRQEFEATARFLVPDAVAIDENGDQILIADAMEESAKAGKVDPTVVFDVVAIPNAVVVKASSDGETGLVLFKLQGGCIFLVSKL